MEKYYINIFLYLFISVIHLKSQNEVVYFKNPSFERENINFLLGNDTLNWMDCGFRMEEPPSFQPGLHDVILPPQHLASYLSLAVRDNNTWDAIGQKLTRPLEAGKCYRFTLHLATTERYVGASRTTNGKEQYRNPIRLLVWGGNTMCEAGQLLCKTNLIKNNEWEPYEFVFQPTTTVYYLTLNAYYLNPFSLSYNGNVLMDNASAITQVPCNEVTIPVQNENIVLLKPSSVEELENFIALHGENIIFNGNKLQDYQEQKLYDPQYWSLIYFSVIGKSMQYFPMHHLTIAVKGQSEKQIQKRMEFIQYFLKERGVKPQAYQCIPYLEGMEKEQWLSNNKSLAFKVEMNILNSIIKRTK